MGAGLTHWYLKRDFDPNYELTADHHIQLWKSAVSGDRSALEQLLRGVQDLIYRFCVSQLHDENAAVEATQETAMRLIDNLGRFSGRGKLTTWVLGIANNVCRETRRRQKKLQLMETGLESVVVSQTTQPGEAASSTTLRSAIAQLPERQREAIVLRYFESLSLAEVAEVMKVSKGTVKATIHQALQKLRLQFLIEE